MLYATVRQRKIHVKNPVTVIQNGINVDELTLNMDDEWAKMSSIICVFTLKHKVAVEEEADGETVTKYEEKEVTKEIIHRFGEPVLVPWECLAETGLLSVSCTGYVGEEKVMTTMMPDSFWTVVQNGPVTGDTPMEPTPTLYEQVLAAAGAASTAASEANAARARLLADKENGAFNGVSPTVEIGNVTTGLAGAEAKVENVGTAQAVKLNFVLPRGVQGPKGEPGIQGAPGERGADGVPGKDGRGVASMEYEASANRWKILYTDGTVQYFVMGNTSPVVENLTFNEYTGELLVIYTSGSFGSLPVTPPMEDVADGAFLRSVDGAMVWESLTNVGEVGV